MIKAYAAHEAGGELVPFEYAAGELGREQVEIHVEYCGICHSDLSMLDNAWAMTRYPFVPGHEIVGTISAVGASVRHLQAGQRVGLGWFSESCMTCAPCLSGDQHMCATAEATIVGRHGGFAETVRAHHGWIIPLPAGVDAVSAGPLFCGGITVFHPILQLGIKPTDHVGVLGIGGLGHMAIGFLHAWGCNVTAFSSSENKRHEALAMGADHFVDSRNTEALATIAGSLDVVLSTVNQPMAWDAYIGVLKPRGRLHLVGAVLEPVRVNLFPMLIGQKSLSASPLGSPATMITMLDFSERHGIQPIVEVFDLKDVNAALQRLRDGEARYRLVLKVA